MTESKRDLYMRRADYFLKELEARQPVLTPSQGPYVRLFDPGPDEATLDATDYMKLWHGRRVDVVARVRITGLWRVRLAEVLVRLAGRLLRARYTLKTIVEDV